MVITYENIDQISFYFKKAFKLGKLTFIEFFKAMNTLHNILETSAPILTLQIENGSYYKKENQVLIKEKPPEIIKVIKYNFWTLEGASTYQVLSNQEGTRDMLAIKIQYNFIKIPEIKAKLLW